MTSFPPVPGDVIRRADQAIQPYSLSDIRLALNWAISDPAFQRHMVGVLKASGVLKHVGQYDPESGMGGIHHGNSIDYRGYKPLFYFEDKS